MAFSEQMKDLRTSKNLSQEQLAEKLHIARQSVSKWERGEGYPSIGTLLRLGTIFEVPVDELLKDDDRLEKKIIKDGENLKHPSLKVFFDFVFLVGLALLVIKLSVILPVRFHWVDWDTSLMQGWIASLAPLAMMLIGGAVSDVLKKEVK